jgi:hypothetical protein
MRDFIFGAPTTSTSSISPRLCRCCIGRLPGGERYRRRRRAHPVRRHQRQAQDAVADAAKRTAQYYVNSRWLGGTLTNWKTISESIKRLRKLDEMLNSGEAQAYTKKERLTLTRRGADELERVGGIKDMGGLPTCCR